MVASDSLIFVESVDANSIPGSTPLEHLRAAAAIVAERGHRAETFARTGSGHIITPHGFADRALDIAPNQQRASAVRCIEASEWGLPVGADYVARHWITAKAEDYANFERLETAAWTRTYAGRPGDYWGVGASPVGMFGNVCDVRLSPDGNTAVTLQWFRNPIASVYGLFAHDLSTGEQRLVTRLSGAMEDHGELSISSDGRYVIAGNPTPQLVDIRTGHTAGFGGSCRAATWYPKAGPSHILAVTGGHEHPPWQLVLMDLATFVPEPFADLPRRVDGIQVAQDGTIVARMRPIDENGWFDELVVSTDDGRTFEPLSPLRGRGGWRRRGTHPRWIEVPSIASSEAVTLDEGFETFLRDAPPDNKANPEEIDWILDTIAPQIKHRIARLGERPAATDALLAELRILTALPALFDPEMLAAVADQVVPAVRAAAVSAEGRCAADLIAAVATSRQRPPFSLAFARPAS